MVESFIIMKLFLLFCSIFGCRSNELINATQSNLCKSVGRFPNRVDPKCQSYMLCLLDQEDQLVSEIVYCPKATIFNAATGRCNKNTYNFVCPHICDGPGKIAYRENNCREYIECTVDLESNMKAELKSCPYGTWFCNDFKECVPGTVTFCDKLINGTSTTTTTTTEVMTTEAFETTTNIISSTDSTAQTWIPTSTSTPVQSSTLEPTKTPTSTANLEPTSTSTASTTTALVENDTTTESNTTPSESVTEPNEENFNFACDRAGKFPIPDNCNLYISCTQGSNGCWKMSLVKCPKKQVFSAIRLQCVLI